MQIMLIGVQQVMSRISQIFNGDDRNKLKVILNHCQLAIGCGARSLTCPQTFGVSPSAPNGSL